jgi:hypothetical protein
VVVDFLAAVNRVFVTDETRVARFAARRTQPCQVVGRGELVVANSTGRALLESKRCPPSMFPTPHAPRPTPHAPRPSP